MMFYLWILHITYAVPILLGVWLGRKACTNIRPVWMVFLQGAVIVFAILYLENLRADSYEWRTYFPDTPMLHQFGARWPLDLLTSSLSTFVWSGPLYLVAFFATYYLSQKSRVES